MSFRIYSSGHSTFYRVPFAQQEKIEELMKRFKVVGIPTLAILHPDGTVLTTNGRGAVSSNKKSCIASWKQKKTGLPLAQKLFG